jgi:hypothetical protein
MMDAVTGEMILWPEEETAARQEAEARAAEEGAARQAAEVKAAKEAAARKAAEAKAAEEMAARRETEDKFRALEQELERLRKR